MFILFIHHFILRLMQCLFSFERAWMSLFPFISSKPQLKSWGWFSKTAPAFRLVINEVKIPSGFSR
jgi:hypothetical protein